MGAAIGIVLAVGGMYELLIPFLVLLGSIIPPVGGVIMADYWYRHRGQYPSLAAARLPRFNPAGLTAYAIGAGLAYTSPWIAPIVGIRRPPPPTSCCCRLPAHSRASRPFRVNDSAAHPPAPEPQESS